MPGNAQTREQKDRVAALQQKHPSFLAMQGEWEKYLRLYEGGIKVKDLLVQHSREHDAMFKVRKERVFYLNFIKQVINTYGFFLFSKPPVRSEKQVTTGEIVQDEEDFKNFLSNVDRRKTDINEFMKDKVLTRMALFGHVYVLVDMPVEQDINIVTEADRKNFEKFNFPYYSIISPLKMVNWSLDADGQYNWIRWEEDFKDEEDPFAAPDKEQEKTIVYKTWTRQQWFKDVVKGSDLIESKDGVNPLGVVPVHKFQTQESVTVKDCGLSAVQDAVFVNLAIYQWCSLLDEEMYQKVLNILAVQKTTGAENEDVILSQNNVLEFSGNVPPAFIAPSAAPAQMIMEAIATFRETLFRLAHLAGSSNPTSGSAGISHAFEFNETNQFLKELSTAMTVGEIELFKFRALWNQTEWTGTVQYADDFGIELLEDLVRQYQLAEQFVKAPSLSLYLRQKIASNVLRRESDSYKSLVLQEIIDGINQEEEFKQEDRENERINQQQAQEASENELKANQDFQNQQK